MKIKYLRRRNSKRLHKKRNNYKIKSIIDKVGNSEIARLIIKFVTAEMLLLVMLPSIILAGFGIYRGLSPFYSEVPGYRLTPPESIFVYRHKTGQVEEIPFEDYVKGVVAGEMPSTFQMEALKAQSVAARTYSYSKLLRSGDTGFPEAHPEAPLCDDTHCQVYRDEAELLALKGQDWIETGWTKICKAVDETKGQLMYYQGELVAQPLFHSSSGGQTENSEDVFTSALPYLQSVSSPYEDGATHQGETKTFTGPQLAALITAKYPTKPLASPISDIRIDSRTKGGRVEFVTINGQTYEGRQIREALGLASANFQITYTKAGSAKVSGSASASGSAGASAGSGAQTSASTLAEDTFTFTTYGYGHGVGMSQYGANGMAQRGADYVSILQHYYTGVEVF